MLQCCSVGRSRNCADVLENALRSSGGSSGEEGDLRFRRNAHEVRGFPSYPKLYLSQRAYACANNRPFFARLETSSTRWARRVRRRAARRINGRNSYFSTAPHARARRQWLRRFTYCNYGASINCRVCIVSDLFRCAKFSLFIAGFTFFEYRIEKEGERERQK